MWFSSEINSLCNRLKKTMAFLPSWRQTHEDGQPLASAVCLVVAFLHLPRGCWAAWRCPQTWRIQSPIPWQLIRRQKINNRLHTTTIFKLWENGLSNHCCCVIRLKILKIQIMIFYVLILFWLHYQQGRVLHNLTYCMITKILPVFLLLRVQ